MNKEILLGSFKMLLNDLIAINDISTNKISKKKELQLALQKADDLIFLNHSSFNTFYASVNEYICSGYKPYAHNIFNKSLFTPVVKKKISEIEVQYIYNLLIRLIETKMCNHLIDQEAAIEKDNQLGANGVFLSSITGVSCEIIDLHKDLDRYSLSKAELKIITNQYVNEIISLINDVLLNDIYRIFEMRKINEEKLPKMFRGNPNAKRTYIKKWIDCKVTFNDVKTFKAINYWEEITEYGLDVDELQKIEIHQKQIFLGAVKSSLKVEISKLKSLPNKLIIAEKNKNLIDIFFKGGNTNNYEVRLKNILNFNNPDQVLLAYDNILREKVNLDELIIFNASNGEFSSMFVATFFMFYLNELESILNNISGNSYSPQKFADLGSEEKQNYILQLLENLSITKNGKSILTNKKKGAIRGVVEGLRDDCILPQISLHQLCIIIGRKINLEINSKLDYHNTAKDFHKKTKQYIKDYPFH